MNDFFGFRKMVSTALIKIIYFFGLIILTLSGAGMVYQGNIMVLKGIGIIVLGNLLWRIICEVWILLFSIHDLLGSIDKKLTPGPPQK